MSDQTIIALIGLFGAITAGFFKLLKDQQKVHEKLADGMEKVAKSSDKQAKEMAKVANATIRSADEAKERNGHLADMQIQQADRVIDSVKNVQKQHVKRLEVENEIVEHQTIKSKEKK